MCHVLVNKPPYVVDRVIPILSGHELVCMPYQVDVQCRYVELSRRDREEVQKTSEGFTEQSQFTSRSARRETYA